jgi:hypothetical protein
MKSFVFVLMFQCFFYAVQSAELVNGYIILPAGDTLRGQIKFGGARGGTNWEEVTLVDSLGVERKYKAQNGEVKGYGYEVMGIKREYIYFLLKPKADSRWFQRVYKGSRYNVYATAMTASFGTVDVTSPWYVLEKPSGEFVFMETCGICAWRKNLTEFLADNPGAVAELENVKAKELGPFLRTISK